MTIKTRQYKQSVINEMTKNDNKDKQYKESVNEMTRKTIKTRQYEQSVINEMTKNDNKEKTIQTISYQRNDKK